LRIIEQSTAVSVGELASFWALCLVQGATVSLPGPARWKRLEALRPHWLLVAAPIAAVIGLTYIPAVAARLGDHLSLLAFVAVPPLAALGAAWAIRWADVHLALLVPVLLAVAWSTPTSALGEAAALLLVVSSCVALATLVVGVLPVRAAALGIVAWAAADLWSALSQDLVDASRAISRAEPSVAPDLLRLQLQRVVVGTSSLEYADLFIAAVLGAILVAESRARGPAALLVAVLAMSLAPFFWITDVVPGTVPVALALLARRRLPGGAPRSSP
jgi:hypothetical protein